MDKERSEIYWRERQEYKVSVPFSRIMGEDRRLPYSDFSKRWVKTLSWDSRMNLLWHIEFLTIHGNKSKEVVIYDADACSHLPLLSSLFPDHHFTAYVRREHPSSSRITQKDINEPLPTTPCLYIHYALAYDNPNLLLEEEKAVNLLQPLASLLRFSLPYQEGNTTFFAGDIYYPVWGPLSSLETVMMVTNLTNASYDHKAYEERMYRFNTITRSQIYRSSPHFLETGYDMQAELHILCEYLKSIGLDESYLSGLSTKITNFYKRTLAERHDLFIKKRKLKKKVARRRPEPSRSWGDIDAQERRSRHPDAPRGKWRDNSEPNRVSTPSKWKDDNSETRRVNTSSKWREERSIRPSPGKWRN